MLLLQALADQASISINNVRMYKELAHADRIRQEMSIATNIQKQLLPTSVPASSNLKIAPYFKPAKEVGGDYYDFIESKDGQPCIVIGDVSGKGLPAGMIMVIARTTLQIVARGKTDVKEAVIHFSKEMYPRMRRGQFMTLNLLQWEDSSRKLSFASAGHEHILWYHADRDYVEKIRAGGIAVGLVDDPAPYIKLRSLDAQPGDVFVLYTDGVTEARNKHELMFGIERLQNSLKTHVPLNEPEKISENIIQDVFAFMDTAEQYDDITLLVLSVSKPG